jgi:predicted GNAT superfamily acetyltransferase
MNPEIRVRVLHSLEEFRRCVEITQEVWGDSDLETEPYVTFVIAHHTGGQVLGAFDGDRMVGFTKAFVGIRDHQAYLHSHMAAVLASHRDRGVGRQLKLAQREEALRRDIRRIEWTFDPLETKNAHFNINRLGAISRTYIQNLYGITSSPLHRGLPTDRLLVEWHLDSARVVAAIQDLASHPQDCPAQVHLATDGKGISADITELMKMQTGLRASLTEWFAKGYAVMGVRKVGAGVDYCLGPYSDF